MNIISKVHQSKKEKCMNWSLGDLQFLHPICHMSQYGWLALGTMIHGWLCMLGWVGLLINSKKIEIGCMYWLYMWMSEK